MIGINPGELISRIVLFMYSLLIFIGSILAVALLVCAMFPAIVSAHTIKPNESGTNIFQHYLVALQEENLFPHEA